MLIKKKKSRIKPLYKQLIRLRINVQNRVKLLKFKRQKWEILQANYLKQSTKWYRKFRIPSPRMRK